MRSWWHLLSALALIGGLETLALLSLPWPIRLAASIVAGLVIVRGFILYHDYSHSSILRSSTIAKVIFNAYGLLVLSPPRAWRQTHNYHHSHTARISSAHIGSYPVLTTESWHKAPLPQRIAYRIVRHPLTIALGYLSVFIYGMCCSSFLRDPRRNWDSLLALVVHAGLAALILATLGGWALFFGFILPLLVSCGFGAYLFYAQHNFEGVRYYDTRDKWSFAQAALESSSYLELGPIMRWFSGNIGYHHIHHFNPRIPFYRLPAVMKAIPELQAPYVTTLRPRDVLASFRQNLWDSEESRMISYRHARRKRARAAKSFARV